MKSERRKRVSGEEHSYSTRRGEEENPCLFTRGRKLNGETVR